jgi:hypothetical protein
MEIAFHGDFLPLLRLTNSFNRLSLQRQQRVIEVRLVIPTSAPVEHWPQDAASLSDSLWFASYFDPPLSFSFSNTSSMLNDAAFCRCG